MPTARNMALKAELSIASSCSSSKGTRGIDSSSSVIKQTHIRIDILVPFD